MATRAYSPRDSRQEYGSARVYSVDELRRVIARIARESQIGLRKTSGIVVDGNILVDRTITIPSTCSGLTITGTGVLTWVASTSGTIFSCSAPDAVFLGLRFASRDAALSVTAIRLESTAIRSAVQSCKARTGVAQPAIYVDANDCVVMGNTVTASLALPAIYVGAGAVRGCCVIVGNNCGTHDIDTTASGGRNTISANTRTGVINAHATDDTLGGNT